MLGLDRGSFGAQGLFLCLTGTKQVWRRDCGAGQVNKVLPVHMLNVLQQTALVMERLWVRHDALLLRPLKMHSCPRV